MFLTINERTEYIQKTPVGHSGEFASRFGHSQPSNPLLKFAGKIGSLPVKTAGLVEQMMLRLQKQFCIQSPSSYALNTIVSVK